MQVTLNLSLELNLPTITASDRELIRNHINKALVSDIKIQEMIKSVHVGAPRIGPTLFEARQAGGLARAASLSAKQRKALAKRAAMARWGKRP